MTHEFSSDLSWKIFLDRYTLKDATRKFLLNDLVIATISPDPKWPTKEIGIVRAILPDQQLEIELLTGDQKSERLVRPIINCDRPLETTLHQVASRIAHGVAAAETSETLRNTTEQAFAEEIQALRFIPGGRIWAAAGTDQKLTYFNCFVIPSPKDSRHGIIDTLDHMIEIMSRGGGVGINISSLRPTHAIVRGVNGRSSGAVSWMDLYSRATGLVEQGGSRRGALMLQMEDWHPDLLQFINIKKTPGMVENANISVRISDKFMQAVKQDEDWNLVFPDTSDPQYDELWNGNLELWQAAHKPIVIHATVKARKIWYAIIEGAWQAAEPGLIFDERTEKESNSWYFNPLVSTNPCAEEPLPAWGVCTLGHINLSAFYDADLHDLNWNALRHTIQVSTRFLDNIVDVTPYFEKTNEDNQQNERRIGLGTMGLGELLIQMHLRYGSPESLKFIQKLYRFITTEAYLYDTQLAQEKGSFPAFNAKLFLQSGFMQRMPEDVQKAVEQYGMRNVTILTQAPTGSVGTMVGTSTGIEPFYALHYTRQSRLGLDQQYVPIAAQWIDQHPDQELPPYFVGAMDLTPEEHVYVQAVIQEWTDSSISKTTNAPSTYTIEDTAKLYELAYDTGCKGITIYRDQSRAEQVLRTDAPLAPNPATASPSESHPSEPPVYPVPSLIHGTTYRKETPAGTARVVINEENSNPFEVFMLLGRAGSEVQSFMEALGRIISLYLRSSDHLTPRERLALVADQLQGIGGANQMGLGPNRVLSVVDALGQLLASHLDSPRSFTEQAAAALETPQEQPVPTKNPSNSYDLCPQCGATSIIREEGCLHCISCGYSKC